MMKDIVSSVEIAMTLYGPDRHIDGSEKIAEAAVKETLFAFSTWAWDNQEALRGNGPQSLVHQFRKAILPEKDDKK